MPDPQPEKRRPLDLPAGERPVSQGANTVPYAELHCRTNFSFLEGASHPDELVHRAQQLGLAARAITDRNSVAGVVRAHAAAKDVGLKLLIGAEVTPVDAPAVVLLATDRAAYGRLCQLITTGRRRASKGECELTFDDVAEHAQGLLACVPLVGSQRSETRGQESAVRDRWAAGAGATNGREAPATRRALLQQYKDAFGDRCYALAELHRGPDDRRVLRRMMDAATKASVPLIAANDVHYHVPQRQFLHETLTAIRHGCTISQLGSRLFPNSDRHLKSSAEMLTLFADSPAAVARTAQVADRCQFSLDELRYQYPRELCPPEFTPIEYLKRLTADGANHRYPHGIPEKVRRLIDHELQLIEELSYEAYFLTVWDLVRFARSRDILCQGRGSAANSAVCYCLGVTSVDSERIDVLFERFISKERDEAPDIDIDFEHERREEVIQYLYEKYGRERAGMAATVITYRPRSAVRDVGKALGLSLDRVDAISKSLERAHGEEELAGRLQNAGLNPTSSVGRQLIGLVGQILDFPRHLSQHVGGMVLTAGPLCEMVPIENAAMPGRTVIQWDKNDLDTLGILKVDCLSLGMLTAIRKCFSLIERHDGRKLTLATVPAEDPAVYEMVSRADTIGVFQIESRAQMSMLPRLRPQCFYDLVIEVAIVRPGPIQGDMVHPYLRRRSGEEPVEFPDERIRAVLQKTLGVPIFQEQAMRLAVVAAGFTPGEADQLRRAMGAWRRRGVIDKFRQKLIDGMDARGYSTGFAERLFNQIRGFGEYGFPESHAASFALLVYVSAWMKRHYPAAFTTALLNSQPMGFYAPAQLISDVRQHGVEVRPIDVNHSNWDCTLEEEARDQRSEVTKARRPRSAGTLGDNPALRLGFRMVRGLSFAHGKVIAERRNGGPFTSFDDFTHRTRLSNVVLKKLSRADAFGTLGLNRRAALWHSLPEQKTLPLFDGTTTEEPAVNLPPLSQKEQVVADYQTAGLSLRGHPIQFIRPLLDELKVVPSSELSHLPVDRRYRVAGVVLLRQRPSTAKGITFVTLEDETGTANLIIRQDVWERYRPIASRAGAMIAHGHLQRLDEVVHLLVDRIEDLSRRLEGLESRSRDFR